MGLPLFAASGDEIVRALKRGGFRVATQSDAYVVLELGHRSVVVPRVHPLHPDDLLGVLRASGVSYMALVELLDWPTHGSSVRRRTLPDDMRTGPATTTTTTRTRKIGK